MTVKDRFTLLSRKVTYTFNLDNFSDGKLNSDQACSYFQIGQI